MIDLDNFLIVLSSVLTDLASNKDRVH